MDPTQLAFRYADPILLVVESVKRLKAKGLMTDSQFTRLESTRWWLSVLTTRVFLAHNALADPGNALVIPPMSILVNVRNVLRFSGVDIAQKSKLQRIVLFNSLNFKGLNDKGKFWLNISEHNNLASLALTEAPFDDAYLELRTILSDLDAENDGVRSAKVLFDRVVGRLVATRCGKFQKSYVARYKFPNQPE